MEPVDRVVLQKAVPNGMDLAGAMHGLPSPCIAPVVEKHMTVLPKSFFHGYTVFIWDGR